MHHATRDCCSLRSRAPGSGATSAALRSRCAAHLLNQRSQPPSYLRQPMARHKSGRRSRWPKRELPRSNRPRPDKRMNVPRSFNISRAQHPAKKSRGRARGVVERPPYVACANQGARVSCNVITKRSWCGADALASSISGREDLVLLARRANTWARDLYGRARAEDVPNRFAQKVAGTLGRDAWVTLAP